MPSACAAAIWPRAIDWMPARMISEKKAASNSEKVISDDMKAPTRIGEVEPVIHCPI